MNTVTIYRPKRIEKIKVSDDDTSLAILIYEQAFHYYPDATRVTYADEFDIVLLSKYNEANCRHWVIKCGEVSKKFFNLSAAQKHLAALKEFFDGTEVEVTLEAVN